MSDNGWGVARGKALIKLAWLPLLLFPAVTAAVWLWGGSTPYEPRHVLVACNALFLTLACTMVAITAARTVLAGGVPSLLAMGAGALAIAVASIGSPLLIYSGDIDAGVTAYIGGMCLAAAFHLIGGIWLALHDTPSKVGWRAIAACYLGAVFSVLLLIYEVDLIPPFLVDGTSTTLRKVVASLTVAQFLIAAGITFMVGRSSRSRFLHWYAIGLALIALGLVAVTGAQHVGSPLTWVGRAAQWTGGVYLLTAITIAMRESRGLTIPLRLLRETHQRYASLVELSPDAILVYTNQRCVFANAAAAELLGAKRPDDLIGATLVDSIPATHSGVLDQKLDTAFEQHVPMQLDELQITRRDNSAVIVEARGVRVEHDGAPSMLLVLRDITARKLAEEELRRSESKFRHLANAMPQLVWAANSRGQVDYFNDRMDEYSHFQRLADGTWDWLQSIHPDDRRRSSELWLAAVAAGSLYQCEHRVLSRSSGEYRWHLSRGVPARTESGELTGWFGTSTDIHDQKRIEEALRQSEHRYHSVFDTMSEGFGIHELIVDKEGKPVDYRFLDVNQAFERMTGLKQDAVIGRLHSEVLPEDNPKWLEMYSRVVLTGTPVQFEEYSPALRRHYDVSAYRTGPMQFAVIFMDITQRKEIEAELRRASAAKDRFIASLSHELRTPLTPVMASVSALAHDRRLPVDIHETLGVIERNIALEVHLINDLLDVTRIVSGKLEIRPEQTDVASVLREVGRIVASDAEAKDQTLTIETPTAPYWVMADAARLHQVFWNLLRNAIKFSPQLARIKVAAGIENGSVYVSVEDSGPGISEEDFPRLFKAFEQGSAGAAVGGLGLGLAICKGIIDLHQGSISAANIQTGSVFKVTLPLLAIPRPRTPVPQPQTTVALAPLKILLVEDHRDSAQVISRLLRNDGHSVTWASSVREATVRAMTSPFDLLISDLGLPDASGHDLMQSLRAAGLHLRAIAVSGYGGSEDIAASLSAGFDEHLTKPVSFDALKKAISRLNAAAPTHSP